MISRSTRRTAALLGVFVSLSPLGLGATMSMFSGDLEEPVERALIPRLTERRNQWERIAEDWTRRYIRPAVHPPKNARFVAIPRADARDCDFLRMCYLAEAGIVTVSQTFCLFSLQLEVDRWGDDGKPDLAELQRLARALLNGADKLELTTGDRALAYAHGRATVPESANTKSPWLSGLQWRQDGDRVVFWWLKYEGEGRKSEPGFSTDDNSRWFSPRVKN